MRKLEKISRENLKSINGSGSVPCLDDPAVIKCYLPGFPNGVCMFQYQCCIKLGNDPEGCKLNP